MDNATKKLVECLTRLAQDIDTVDEIPDDLEPGELSWMLRKSAQVITKLAENKSE